MTKGEIHGLKVLCGLYSSDVRCHTCHDCNHPEESSFVPLNGRARARESMRLKRMRGCIGKGEIEYTTHDGTCFRECPRLYEQTPLFEYLRAYRWFEAGVLPVEGGLVDQPAKLVQAFEVIRGTFAAIQAIKDKERAEELRSKAAR